MCPSGCGPLYKPGTDLRDTTCPCGFGYFDRSGFFVAGDFIRAGQAISREAYATHPHSCPVHVDPRNRNLDPGSSISDGQGRGFRDYFLPGTGIDLEILKIYVAYDGPTASVRPSKFNGQLGYLIHGKQMPAGAIANIKADSAHTIQCRQKYGSRMPHWGPIEPGLQAQGSSRAQQDASYGVPTSGHRLADIEHSHQPIPPDRLQRVPVIQSNHGYERTSSRDQEQPPIPKTGHQSSSTPHSTAQSQYADRAGRNAVPGQDTSLADRFGQFSLSSGQGNDPHRTATQGLPEQSVVPDNQAQRQRSVGIFSSPSDFLTAAPSTGLTGARESYPRTAPRYDRQGILITADAQGSWAESPYQGSTESRRPSNFGTSDQSRTPQHDIPRSQGPWTEQERERRPERNQRTGRTYIDPRDQRISVTPSTPRSYDDSRDSPASRYTRREQFYVNKPPDEDDEPLERHVERDTRR